jgi:hypothetical protein
MGLPREIFEQKLAGEAKIADEGSVFYAIEKVTFEGGIKQHILGAEYPHKGLAMPEAIFAVNLAKRLVVEMARIGVNWQFWGVFVLIGISSYKAKIKLLNRIIGAFNSVTERTIEGHIMKMQYMTPCAREIRCVVHNILWLMGIDKKNAEKFSDTFSHMFEYDNAYRYRIQDLFHASSKEAITKKPIKEVVRLMKLSKERDAEGIHDKFKFVMIPIVLVLMIPKVRKAFVTAFDLCQFEALQFDEADIYYVSMRTDYKYLGEDIETRSKRNAGKKIPVPMPKNEYEEYLKKKNEQNNKRK